MWHWLLHTRDGAFTFTLLMIVVLFAPFMVWIWFDTTPEKKQQRRAERERKAAEVVERHNLEREPKRLLS